MRVHRRGVVRRLREHVNPPPAGRTDHRGQWHWSEFDVATESVGRLWCRVAERPPTGRPPHRAATGASAVVKPPESSGLPVRASSAAAGDRALLDAWAQGDADAGDELVRRYVDVVHRFFASKLDGDIEDLAQTTLLACVQQRAHFRGEASFKTYLLAIARRKLMLHLRKSYRGERALRLNDVSMLDIVGSPSQRVLEREEFRLLAFVLRQLPLELQMTVELFYWEELATADIAIILEVAKGTVKSRLARARELLREGVENAAASPQLRRSTLENLDDWARQLWSGSDREE